MTTELQVSSEKVSEKETQLTVKVPVGQIQQKVEGRIRKMSKTARVDGFRKGKVPVSYIRSQYGAGIQQEVINDEIRDTVFDAIKKQEIRAVGIPNIDDVKVEDDFLVYQATVEIFPEIAIQGMDEVDVERHTAVVSDEDVDEMVENLRQQRQEYVDKDGEIAENDQAVFDFLGTVDGEAFEGGAAEDFELVIGSNRFIPGFEDGMIGMKAGEEKQIDVTFPEDYQAENLAGKAAQFKVTLKSVQQPQLPEINDEFCKLFGVEEGGLEQLKIEVRKNMEREIKNATRNQIKEATLNALLEKNEFDVPAAMLEQEVDRQRNQMIQRFAQQFGADPQGFDQSMFPNEMFEDQATRAARLGIIVARIIDTEEITVDAARVEKYIQDSAENYEDPQEVIDYLTNDEQQRASVEAIILEEQVVEHVLDKGKVTDKEVSYQELLAASQQQQNSIF